MIENIEIEQKEIILLTKKKRVTITLDELKDILNEALQLEFGYLIRSRGVQK